MLDEVPEIPINEVVLHKSYSADIGQEEIEKEWRQAVKSFRKANKPTGYSTEWYYKVWTVTGTQTHNETDARVTLSTRFNTSVGTYKTGTVKLDIPGYDDRERGQVDVYLVRAAFPRKAVKWVGVREAVLGLKGKDGWFVKGLVVDMYANDQTVPARGYSEVTSSPNSWLDNDRSSSYMYFHTGYIGNGKLRF